MSKFYFNFQENFAQEDMMDTSSDQQANKPSTSRVSAQSPQQNALQKVKLLFI